MFDCRSVPNPGRLPQFATLTGKDQEVQAFLNKEPLACRFKELTFSLVENSIQEYLRRDFEALEVAYGCTGGQHRSVFFAEQLNLHIADRYPVKTQLRHLVIDSW